MENVKNYLTGLIVLVLAASVLTAPVACTMHRNNQITRMVFLGADPQAARCALTAVDTPAEAMLCMRALGGQP
jgi:hypothetical protein